VLVAGNARWPEPAWFLDARPDADNARYGHPYRLDVPVHRLNARWARGVPPRLHLRVANGAYTLDPAEADRSLVTARYFGDKHVAVSRDKSLRRVMRGASGAQLHAPLPLASFVPLALTTSTSATAMTAAGETDEVDGETLQEHMFRRAKQYNERLRQTPHDVALWLEFAAFQEQFVLAQSDASDAAAVDDKRIAILEAALRDNADSDELQIAYLEACGRRWDQPSLERLWRSVLASHSANARLWLGYIAFRSSYFGTFSVGAVRAVYAEAIEGLMSARHGECDELVVRHLETAVVSVLVKYVVFERQSGRVERAVACLQALLEFNVFRPREIPHNRLMSAFADFWDSEAPRIGDDGARGWCNSLDFDAAGAAQLAAANAPPPPPPPPPPDSPPPSSPRGVGPQPDAELARALAARRRARAWLAREQAADARFWQPARFSIEPMADDSDAAEIDTERAVLFADVRPFVVALSLPSLHYELLCQLGSFFGFDAAPRRPTSHPLVRDREGEREHLATVLERFGDGDEARDDAPFADRHWRDEPRAPLNTGARAFVRRAFELAAGAWQVRAGERRRTFDYAAEALHLLRATPVGDLSVLERVVGAMPLGSNGEQLRASMATQALLRLAGAQQGADQAALKAVRRAAKALLSERRADLALWCAYAGVERDNENCDEALRILQAALQSVELRGSSADAPVFALVHAYVETVLFRWRAPADPALHVGIARAGSVIDLLTLSGEHRRAAYALAGLAGGKWLDESAAPVGEVFGATRVVRVRSALRQRAADADAALAEVEVALQQLAQLRKAARGPAGAAAATALSVLHDDVAAESERRRDAQLSAHVLCAALEFVLGTTNGLTSARLALGAALGHFDARSWRREALVCAWLRLEQFSAAVRREPPSHAAHVLQCGLADYPTNVALLAAFVRSSSARARLGSNVRRYFDARCRARALPPAAPLEWLVAIAAERRRAASGSRVRALFEKALGGQSGRAGAARHSIVLWRFYMHYELAAGDARSALRVFFRAARSVPWCKALWLDLLATDLLQCVTPTQLREVMQLIDEKDVRLRSGKFDCDDVRARCDTR
jgi:hypothetical protein